MIHATSADGREIRQPASRLRDFITWRIRPAAPVPTPAARARDVPRRPVATPSPAAPSDEKGKGQFFTRPDLAKHYVRVLATHVDLDEFQIVEPSAGRGAFLDVLPEGSFACDIEAMSAGVFVADFLTLEIGSNRPLMFVGNPPYGRNASLARRFFNHAASQCDVIAFILPRTFRKAGIINRLDDRFHLLHEEPVPARAFLFKGKPHSVPTVFQIWARREHRRAPLPDARTHPDFEFTTAEEGDFGMQRVGKNAGRVHREMHRSHHTHYFIKGDVEGAMRRCRSAFAAAAANAAGHPSLSMSEVVAIYDAQVARDRSSDRPSGPHDGRADGRGTKGSKTRGNAGNTPMRMRKRKP